jgi:hypothetical protein
VVISTKDMTLDGSTLEVVPSYGPNTPLHQNKLLKIT